MRNPLGGGNGMTLHYSGSTLDAQARYASGTKEILENYFDGKDQNPANVIVGKGEHIYLISRGVRPSNWSLHLFIGRYETKSCMLLLFFPEFPFVYSHDSIFPVDGQRWREPLPETPIHAFSRHWTRRVQPRSIGHDFRLTSCIVRWQTIQNKHISSL